MKQRLMFTIGALALVMAGAAIAYVLVDRDVPEACDGIAAEMGGCDQDLPDFAGTTCDAVAREFAVEYEERATAIFDGQPTVEEASRSVRIIQLTNLLTQLANRHVRAVGLGDTCDADAFFATVEGGLSRDFMERVGTYLYEDGSGSYEAWAGEVRTFLTILEEADGPQSNEAEALLFVASWRMS